MAESASSPHLSPGCSRERPCATGGTARRPPTGLPSTIGAYEVIGRIGYGGMGEVVLARDKYGHEVAIKLLGAGRPVGDKYAKRFMREARALAVLQHRNICRIYGVEEDRGRPCMVMEHVRGVSLTGVLDYLADPTSSSGTTGESGGGEELSTIVEDAGRRLPTGGWNEERVVRPPGTRGRTLAVSQAIGLVMRLCEAVHYAHEHGILHRDIKPSNVIIRPDGEPVLLDFGVAKQREKAGEEQLTVTGQMFGTIEYMSPEQALSSRDVDERADVYSIGAILYELLTGTRHFASSGNVVLDAKRLEIHEPSSPRRVCARVDKELEAIVLKALSPDRGRRYRSANQLRQELVRYRGGEPVMARAPTPWYRLGRKLRRHKTAVVLSILVLALAAALGGYFAWEYYRQWGTWVRVFHHDFRTDPAAARHFVFLDEDGAAGQAWPAGSGGLDMGGRDGWCWLKNVKVSGNVRVVAQIAYDGIPDGFEVVINSAADTAIPSYYVPRGYSCQVGGYRGTLDFVSINKSPGMARVGNPVPSVARRDTAITIMLQRQGKDIDLYINGECRASERDNLPFWGPEFGRIGFRTYAQALRLLSVDVYDMALPEKAPPTIAGEALAASGFYEDAIEVYLNIARDYRGSSLGERAMVGAALSAYEIPGGAGERKADSIIAAFSRLYPRSTYWEVVRERQLAYLWRKGEFDRALLLLQDHFRSYPSSEIALELNTIRPDVTVGPAHRSALLQWVIQTPGLTSLDMSTTGPEFAAELEGVRLTSLNCRSSGLSNLSPLHDHQLRWLRASENRISDLSPLAGQPLTYLNIGRNYVEDLGPLAGAPLAVLNASHNRIRELSPLSGCPLEDLNVAVNLISDLSPLADCPLTRLRVNANRVRSLAPLAGARIEYLACEDNPIEDFSPLKGMPLTKLHCGRTRLGDLTKLKGLPLRSLECSATGIRDLSPLRGMPLEEFYCAENQISDIRPLAELPLERLSISQNPVSSLQPLRGLPLRAISFNNCRVSSLLPLRGMPLEHVDCRNNPITSLAPLVEDPPARFYFFTKTLPVSELERAVRIWESSPSTKRHALHARMLLFVKENRYTQLRSFATPFEGHHYLLVPLRLSWEEADRWSRRCGGHLVTLTSDRERRFMASLKGNDEHSWVGLRKVEEELQWVTGESVAYVEQRISRGRRDRWAMVQRRLQPWPAYATAFVIVEWD